MALLETIEELLHGDAGVTQRLARLERAVRSLVDAPPNVDFVAQVVALTATLASEIEAHVFGGLQLAKGAIIRLHGPAPVVEILGAGGEEGIVIYRGNFSGAGLGRLRELAELNATKVSTGELGSNVAGEPIAIPGLSITGRVFLSNYTVAEITENKANLSFGSWVVLERQKPIYRLSASAGGFVMGAIGFTTAPEPLPDGITLLLQNTSANAIVIADQSEAKGVERFRCKFPGAANQTIEPLKTIGLVYNQSIQRWERWL